MSSVKFAPPEIQPEVEIQDPVKQDTEENLYRDDSTFIQMCQNLESNSINSITIPSGGSSKALREFNSQDLSPQIIKIEDSKEVI